MLWQIGSVVRCFVDENSILAIFDMQILGIYMLTEQKHTASCSKMYYQKNR